MPNGDPKSGLSKSSSLSSDQIKELIKKRGTVKGRLTNFRKYISSFIDKTLTNEQRAELKLRMQGALSLYKDFNEIQNYLEISLSESDLVKQLEERECFESLYYGVLAQTQCMINKDNEMNIPKSANNSIFQSVKLPTISLPTFDGSYEHWLEFRDTFQSLVHNSNEITKIQKLHYLKSSLKSSAALVIDSLEFSESNYTVAWELLLNRYNNNRLLVHNHVKSLFSLPLVTRESPGLLRKLIDTVLKNIRALKILGEPTDSWDTLIIYMIVSRLDLASEREWEKVKCTFYKSTDESQNCVITLNNLIKFLRDRADMLETLCVTHAKSGIHYENKRQHPSSSAHNHMHKVHCNFSTDKPKNYTKDLCIMCKAKHKLYSCQTFLEYDLQDKIKFIHQKGLCENCLRPGHVANECRNGPCRKCDKKHNTLIHTDKTSERQSQIPTSKNKVISPNLLNSSVASSNSDNSNKIIHNSAQVSNSHIDVLSAQTSASLPILLSTAVVKIADSLGNYHKARAVLDSGSERCFITQSLCDKLNLQLIQSTHKIRGIGGNTITQCSKTCDIELKSVSEPYITHVNKCLVLPQITSSLPAVNVNIGQFRIPTDIQLADSEFYQTRSIDLLIGADIFWDLLCEGRIRLSNGPYLQNTRLGWIISGPIYSQKLRNKNYIHCNFIQSFDAQNISIQSIDKQLRMFWEIEDLSVGKRGSDGLSEEERLCEKHFKQTTTRDVDGRFCVRIPFKLSPDFIGESFNQAKRRFLALENRLKHNPNLNKMYKAFIHEYMNLGHMTKVHTYGNPHYFMPHHGVLRENAISTRLRVVFDASAASTSGKSLNDLQLVGPPIQGDLIAILLRFRENKYVACADVEKMYRQVHIDKSQRDLQLIIWRDSPSDPLQIYQLNTVTYGTASAPFLSCRCLKQLAQDCDNPIVARTISEDFYVDDGIILANTKSELLELCRETSKVLKSGCFHLRKWIYNFEQEGSAYINEESKEFLLNNSTLNKTLGLGWYNKSDELHFASKIINNPKNITKRIILSQSSQIFDPLGLLGPMIITAKILLQKLWLLKVEWDEHLQDDIAQIWKNFVDNLSILKSLRVPRYVMGSNPERIELHIFTDASQTAYGACAYIRTVDVNSCVVVKLLCSKGKVAPLKPISIPRLELCGALLGARLFEKIINALRSKLDNVVFWTDSTIVLGWLRMPPNLLKTFVQNRTAEILDLTKDRPWRHVSGKANPADLISRGQSLDLLCVNSLWFQGPQFLYDLNLCDTNNTIHLNDMQLPEIKSNLICSSLSNRINKESVFSFERFSQFNRLQRSCAYVLRFIYNARYKNNKRTGPLTVDELNESLLLLAKYSQHESFLDVNKLLLNRKPIKDNGLLKLNLFLDRKNIIRVGGRILQSFNFDFNKKHPILLSSKHHFTHLLFKYEHKRLMHAGPQLLLYTVREMWWPVGGRNLSKKVVHSCVKCTRMRGQTVKPIMGNLPQARLDPGFPFLRCGVDYAGPVLILNRKGRGAKTIKSFICLFICFTTRAVHLELVSDLSSDAYLLALKRFISRRGKPIEIYSDNGRNFVGLMHDFAKLLSQISKDLEEYATSQSIKFKMGPPYASHFGGLWEAGIKSCKQHLRRVIGNAHLTFEELCTVLVEIEAVLNSRPLTPMSTDPHDYHPLSPSHFLVGRPLTSPVSVDLNTVPEHRLTRYQRVEQIRQHFWSRWSKEYISELQVRTKWTEHKGDLQENTLVLIKDDNQPPLKWRMGRIIKTFPGNDGVSRVADIRTVNGTVRRAFPKICPLFSEEM